MCSEVIDEKIMSEIHESVKEFMAKVIANASQSSICFFHCHTL